MTFVEVPVNVVGGSAESESRPVSVKSTVNMYPRVSDSERSPTTLLSWPGPKAWSAGTTTLNDRGLYEFDGTLYKVTDTTLYSVTSTGVQTSIGTIAGNQRCYFADNAGTLIIVSAGSVYVYDKVSLATVTDSDLEDPYTVTMINNQWIYDNDGTSGRWVVSDAGTPGSINALNYATAESNGDRLLRVFVFQQRLYLFGEHTIEPWFNSGVGTPPFDREEGGLINKGLGARASAAASDEFVYFLGDDARVYRISGYQVQNITTPEMSDQFNGYTTISDAIGFVITWSNQDFYVISFPTENETWAVSQQNGEWIQLSSGTSGGKWDATSYAYAYNKHLVSYGGAILELDKNTFTDNGNTWVRERTFGPINGNYIGRPGRRIAFSRLRLLTETGVGSGSGEGLDPDVIMSSSSDGGRVFGNERMVPLGRDGQYNIDCDYYQLLVSMDVHIRARVTDPVDFSIHSASAELQEGGF